MPLQQPVCSSNRMVPERVGGTFYPKDPSVTCSLSPGLRKNVPRNSSDITGSSAHIPSVHQEEVTHGMLLGKETAEVECQSSGDLMILPSVAVSKTSFLQQHWVTTTLWSKVALLDNWLAGQEPLPMLPFVNSWPQPMELGPPARDNSEGKWPKSLLRPQRVCQKRWNPVPPVVVKQYLPLKKIKAGGKKRGHHTNQQELFNHLFPQEFIY